MKIPSIFNNKYVGYAIIALGAIHVLGYMGEKAWECMVFFGLTCIAVERKFKNRSVAILSGIFLANMIFGCGRTLGVSEGFVGNYFKTSADFMREGATGVIKATDAAATEADKAKEKASTCKAGEELKNGKCVEITEAKAEMLGEVKGLVKGALAKTEEADKVKKETDATKPGGIMNNVVKAAAEMGKTSLDKKKPPTEKEEEEADESASPVETEDPTEGFEPMSGGQDEDALGLLSGGDNQLEHFDNGRDIYKDFLTDASRGGELIDGINDRLVQEGFVSGNDHAAMDLRMQKYGQYNPNNVGY